MIPYIELTDKRKGYNYIIIFRADGFRCGYVEIPKSHTYFGKHYDDIPVKCYGGLTYSGSKLPWKEGDDSWWIGFDCCHFGDGRDLETAEKYYHNDEEAMRLINWLRTLPLRRDIFLWTPVSLNDCKLYCDRIVDQLINLERMETNNEKY